MSSNIIMLRSWCCLSRSPGARWRPSILTVHIICRCSYPSSNDSIIQGIHPSQLLEFWGWLKLIVRETIPFVDRVTKKDMASFEETKALTGKTRAIPRFHTEEASKLFLINQLVIRPFICHITSPFGMNPNQVYDTHLWVIGLNPKISTAILRY